LADKERPGHLADKKDIKAEKKETKPEKK